MKRLICHLFGHRQFSGRWGDGLYGRVQSHGVDGTGVYHSSVEGECDRCGERYVMARFHGRVAP